MLKGDKHTPVDVTFMEDTNVLKGFFALSFMSLLFRGVDIMTKASATIRSSRSRNNLESGFRVDTAAEMNMVGCSSEDDRHGCVAVGLDTRCSLDTVAVLRSKSDGFQIYSRFAADACDNCAGIISTCTFARTCSMCNDC